VYIYIVHAHPMQVDAKTCTPISTYTIANAWIPIGTPAEPALTSRAIHHLRPGRDQGWAELHRALYKPLNCLACCWTPARGGACSALLSSPSQVNVPPLVPSYTLLTSVLPFFSPNRLFAEDSFCTSLHGFVKQDPADRARHGHCCSRHQGLAFIL